MRLFHVWQLEASLFKTLVEQPEAVTIPVQNLQPVASPICKHEQVSRHRVGYLQTTYLPAQSVEGFPHVNRSGEKKYRRAGADRNHESLRSAATIDNKGTDSGKWRIVPSGNEIRYPDGDDTGAEGVNAITDGTGNLDASACSRAIQLRNVW